jgi:cell division protein FtsN
MAQHDYINKQPKNTKKKQAKPAKKPFPMILLVFAALLISGFIYGLWYIKNNADPSEVKQVQKTEKPKKVIPKPRPPEFLEEIKNHEVKVKVKELEKKGPYQMQCGSFRQEAQANTMKANMAFAGLIAEVRKTEGSNGVWYRVRLGPYERKRQAESDKNKLKRINIVSCGIWGWT